MECIYVALLNLPLSMRYRMENLFPVTLCNTSTLKRFGTRVVIGGRGGGDDEFDHPRSLGAVMRKLDAGMSLKFPSAEAEPLRGSGAGLRVPLVLWLAAALPSGLPSRWEGPADRGVGLRHSALPGLHVEAVMD